VTTERRAEQFVQNAIDQGKIAPDGRRAWYDAFIRDEETARALVNSAPESVQKNRRGAPPVPADE
jgi:hypothetical protein